MKIGTFSRTSEHTYDGRPNRFSDLREIARIAEAVGLDSYWLLDHLLYRPNDLRQDVT